MVVAVVLGVEVPDLFFGIEEAVDVRAVVVVMCVVGVGVDVGVAGMEEACSSQASKVLPEGNPAAFDRAPAPERSRPATSSSSSALSTSAGSQRWALAVARISGAARRACGIFSRRNRGVSSSKR
mgnify:CR=1 FL=1